MGLTCCADKCHHTARTCKLKRFPTDANRARLWERNLNRTGWIRKYYHRLCKCHFDETQFENNEGRRLRPFAVPKLFPTHIIDESKTSNIPCPESVSILRGPSLHFEPLKTPEFDVVELLQSSVIDNMEASQISDISCPKVSTPEPARILTKEDFLELTKHTRSPEINCQKPPIPKPTFTLPKADCLKPVKTGNISEFYIITPLMNSCTSGNSDEIKAETSSDVINRLEKEKTELRRENYRLKKKLSDLLKICQNFNNDELTVLKGKKPQKWSDQTFNKCLETRIAVGRKGYEFLLKQGYPLVSYSSLCRYIQNLADSESSQFATSLLEEEDDDEEEEIASLQETPSSSSDDEENFEQ